MRVVVVSTNKNCLIPGTFAWYIVWKVEIYMRKFTLLDAPFTRGGPCRYISRFASYPTKAVRQLQLTGARQAECLSR